MSTLLHELRVSVRRLLRDSLRSGISVIAFTLGVGLTASMFSIAYSIRYRAHAHLASRYRLSHGLGAGGMATVYSAEDLKLARRVAIKVLRPELAFALGPERFLREIRTTAGLRHPHILPLFDSGQADDWLF